MITLFAVPASRRVVVGIAGEPGLAELPWQIPLIGDKHTSTRLTASPIVTKFSMYVPDGIATLPFFVLQQHASATRRSQDSSRSTNIIDCFPIYGWKGASAKLSGRFPEYQGTILVQDVSTPCRSW